MFHLEIVLIYLFPLFLVYKKNKNLKLKKENIS